MKYEKKLKKNYVNANKIRNKIWEKIKKYRPILKAALGKKKIRYEIKR